MKQTIIIQGSTGSIGRQSLEVIKANPDRFELIGISAAHDSGLFRQQAAEWNPRYIACQEFVDRSMYPDSTEIFCGDDASERLAEIQCDIVILAVSGFAALRPLLKSLQNTKRVAIANKESLVCGETLVTDMLKVCRTELIPIDSEQSALFQCLHAGGREEVQSLILTASGGPFFRMERKDLEKVTIDQVLSHPTWNMGRKITLDSATLFNKGLEIMEASRLFDFGPDQISVLIHPQSIVHSLVEFRDGSMIANLAVADMRLPIQYALTYPDRFPAPVNRLDLCTKNTLTFYEADEKRFPAIRMAYEALRREQGYPIVYNGANEMAASLYFDGVIRFLDIEKLVERAMNDFTPARVDSIDAILEIDQWSRSHVKKVLKDQNY